MTKVKPATIARINDFDIICPHCGERDEGWRGDPRNNTTEQYECSWCNGLFTIYSDLKFEFL